MKILEVSIIVPVYNEEKRIPKFFRDLLNTSTKLDCEIILVNDGSFDNTLFVIENILKDMGDIEKENEKINIISYKENRGKGYAVRKGVMSAKGEKIIFIDADGSIHPDNIPRMVEKLDEYDIVVGDRNSKNSKIKTGMLRKITSVLFNVHVALIFNSKIRDNLCGFKGFGANIAKDLFNDMLEERWLFDVELFYKIRKRSYSHCGLPLEWVHMNGTKMSITDPLKMFVQLINLRWKLYNHYSYEDNVSNLSNIGEK